MGGQNAANDVETLEADNIKFRKSCLGFWDNGETRWGARRHSRIIDLPVADC